MSDLKKIKDEFLIKLQGKLNQSEINEIKSDLFGKNGLIPSQFKKIGTIADSEKKKFASDLNIIKDELQNLIESKIENTTKNEETDLTLESTTLISTTSLGICLSSKTNLFSKKRSSKKLSNRLPHASSSVPFKLSLKLNINNKIVMIIKI